MKVRSKEYCLIKQGLRKLKAKEKKKSIIEIIYIIAVEFSNIPNPYLLPLADFFNFNFSFSILLNIISDNTPIFFFIKYFRFSSSFYIISLYPSY